MAARRLGHSYRWPNNLMRILHFSFTLPLTLDSGSPKSMMGGKIIQHCDSFPRTESGPALPGAIKPSTIALATVQIVGFGLAALRLFCGAAPLAARRLLG